jgi:uncharacterized glyoxalase superfamily protein PhnB
MLAWQVVETDHHSGQFRHDVGSPASSSVPEIQPNGTRLVLRVPDAAAFDPEQIVEVVTPFESTHRGTQEMTVRDPDGRLWSVQAPAAS